jgi:hypothetical protein
VGLRWCVKTADSPFGFAQGRLCGNDRKKGKNDNCEGWAATDRTLCGLDVEAQVERADVLGEGAYGDDVYACGGDFA